MCVEGRKKCWELNVIEADSLISNRLIEEVNFDDTIEADSLCNADCLDLTASQAISDSVWLE